MNYKYILPLILLSVFAFVLGRNSTQHIDNPPEARGSEIRGTSDNYASITFIRKDRDSAYLIIYQLRKSKDIQLVKLTQDFMDKNRAGLVRMSSSGNYVDILGVPMLEDYQIYYGSFPLNGQTKLKGEFFINLPPNTYLPSLN